MTENYAKKLWPKQKCFQEKIEWFSCRGCCGLMQNGLSFVNRRYGLFNSPEAGITSVVPKLLFLKQFTVLDNF